MATNTSTSVNNSDAQRRSEQHKTQHETPIEGVMGEVMFEPDSARFEIGKLRGHQLVDVSINNDALNMRSLLEPEQAESIGRRLLDMAEAAREDNDADE